MTLRQARQQGREILPPHRGQVVTGQNSQVVPLGAKLVVGGIAGMVGMAAIFPIDLVKTQLQQNQRGEGVVACVRRLVAQGGWRAFYRGLGACLCGVAPEKAIKLAVNEKLRERFTAQDQGRISLAHEVMAGAGAGVCQVTASNPVEIVKIRLQTGAARRATNEPEGGGGGGGRHHPHNNNNSKSAWAIVRELHVRGLYKGLPATLMRDVPFSFLFFPIYANLRDAWRQQQQAPAPGNEAVKTSSVDLVPTLLSGAVAGAIAAAAVTPADVVKTRYQVESSPYSSLAQCARALWREEGPRGFMKGAVERMAIQAPLYGIALLAFELQKKWYLSSDVSNKQQ